MATSIEKAKEARGKLAANSHIGAHSVRYEMCVLVEKTLDDLVNISGAHCPERMPDLREQMADFTRDKCSERDMARFSTCKEYGATTFGWRNEKGLWRVTPCFIGRGGTRG